MKTTKIVAITIIIVIGAVLIAGSAYAFLGGSNSCTGVKPRLGNIVGMISINDSKGATFYYTWCGAFIQQLVLQLIFSNFPFLETPFKKRILELKLISTLAIQCKKCDAKAEAEYEACCTRS